MQKIKLTRKDKDNYDNGHDDRLTQETLILREVSSWEDNE